MTPLKIDWATLRAQKEFIFKLSDSDVFTERNRDLLGGVVYLLDYIQDAAVECGEATELEVFGELK